MNDTDPLLAEANALATLAGENLKQVQQAVANSSTPEIVDVMTKLKQADDELWEQREKLFSALVHVSVMINEMSFSVGTSWDKEKTHYRHYKLDLFREMQKITYVTPIYRRKKVGRDRNLSITDFTRECRGTALGLKIFDEFCNMMLENIRSYLEQSVNSASAHAAITDELRKLLS